MLRGLSSSLGERGYALLVMPGFLTGVAALVAQAAGHLGLQQLRHVGSGLENMGSIAVHRPSCSAARGIFPEQGPNPGLLHQQVDFLPLSHRGSPDLVFYGFILMTIQTSVI